MSANIHTCVIRNRSSLTAVKLAISSNDVIISWIPAIIIKVMTTFNAICALSPLCVLISRLDDLMEFSRTETCYNFYL